jgi:hypothetical protein
MNDSNEENAREKLIGICMGVGATRTHTTTSSHSSVFLNSAHMKHISVDTDKIYIIEVEAADHDILADRFSIEQQGYPGSSRPR